MWRDCIPQPASEHGSDARSTTKGAARCTGRTIFRCVALGGESTARLVLDRGDMKTPRWMIPVLLALSFGRPAEALDKPELDQRIRTLALRFEAMQLKPDRCIAADTLKRARGIVLLDRTKA